MDINFSNIGINGGTMGANNIGAQDKTVGKQGAEGTVANLTIGMRTDGISSGEPVIAISDAELTRDDALGKLVGAAFNLPPPAMPNFS